MSILLLAIGLFRFSVSVWVSLGSLYIPRNLSILFIYFISILIYWHNNFLNPFISVNSVVRVPLSFLILVICFLFSLYKGLPILLIFFSKNQLLGLQISWIVFLFSIVFTPTLISIISFLFFCFEFSLLFFF